MDLQTYLSNNNLTASALAVKLGVAHTTVSRWLNGGAFPEPAALAKIHAQTDGQVTANDFMAARAAE